MIEHLIFLTYLIIITFSIIGHGYIFSVLIDKNLIKLNFGYIGLIGIFSLITISVLTSFFFSHNYFFNSFLHIIGVASFFFFLSKYSKNNFSQLKKLTVLLLILILGVFLYKNHDDFGYYHLSYALNLSENKFMIGMGYFGHGFKTPSSLFYFHSILFLPYVKYYLFHSGPFFIILFFNFLLINKILEKFKKSEFELVYYLSLLCIIFTNVVFYRLSEHGTDRSSQILLLLIFIFFYELYYLKMNKLEKNNLFNFFLILIFLAASMKALYYIYIILIPLLIFKNKYIFEYLRIYNLKILFVIFLCAGSYLSVNFLSTGCLLFPASKTCNYNLDWSLKEKEVKGLKTHYEWWAKAGGGPGYESELSKEEYVKKFNWLEDWIERHFFNKVSDSLLGIIFISILVTLLFKNKKKNNKKGKINIIYIILFLFLSEWFLNHPSMRYGGFVLFALPIFFLTSNYLSTFVNSKKKVYYTTIALILVSLLIYNTRNFLRINNEILVYNYPIFDSPFFYDPNVKVKIISNTNNLKIYKPKNKQQMCWSAKTPCVYRENLSSKKINFFDVIQRND